MTSRALRWNAEATEDPHVPRDRCDRPDHGERAHPARCEPGQPDEHGERGGVVGAIHPLDPEADPELVRGGDILHLAGDAAKLRAATGWAPRYSLDDTLKEVVDA